MSTKRKVLSVAVAGGLALGGLSAGAVLAAPELAVAQDATIEDHPGAHAVDRIRSALDGLVEEGVITADQAEAVAETLAEAFDKPFRRFGDRGLIERAAEVIGVEPPDLVAELREGRSIAEVASEHGVEAQAVIDELVAAENEFIDQKVAEGRITDEQAQELREGMAERIEALVNGELPGPRSGRRGFRGPWFHFAPPDAEAEDTATST